MDWWKLRNQDQRILLDQLQGTSESMSEFSGTAESVYFYKMGRNIASQIMHSQNWCEETWRSVKITESTYFSKIRANVICSSARSSYCWRHRSYYNRMYQNRMWLATKKSPSTWCDLCRPLPIWDVPLRKSISVHNVTGPVPDVPTESLLCITWHSKSRPVFQKLVDFADPLFLVKFPIRPVPASAGVADREFHNPRRKDNFFKIPWIYISSKRHLWIIHLKITRFEREIC